MNLAFNLSFLLLSQLAYALGPNTVCFYDATAVEREGNPMEEDKLPVTASY